MRQRNVRYISRMIIKTLLLIVPLLFMALLIIAPNFPNGDAYVADMSSDLWGFYNLPINAWYNGALTALGLEEWAVNSNSYIINALIVLPLYFIWVEIFDLLLHLIFFFTDLFHKFLGGDK